MSRRIIILAALLGLALIPVAKAGRWDVALNGGWMRCLLDVDQVNQTIASRIYEPASMGSNLADVESLILIDAGANYLLQGTITKGTFHIGMGKKQYTVGDRFFLFVSKYTDNVLLILVDQMSVSDNWSTPLTYF